MLLLGWVVVRRFVGAFVEREDGRRWRKDCGMETTATRRWYAGGTMSDDGGREGGREGSRASTAVRAIETSRMREREGGGERERASEMGRVE
jgi:hypothetical protein